jgi:DNA-binding ferritin-like protein
MKYLVQLLAMLRAMHWAHWTAHWKMQGNSFYGDHLLFQRMYEGMVEEIDTLAEKIVGIYGPDALFDIPMMADAQRFLTGHDDAADPYSGAKAMEEHLQAAIKTTYEALKESGEITLGLDDFLMAMASAHETNLYLLGQKLRTAALKKAVSGDPYWMVARYPGRDQNGKPFKKGDKVFFYPRSRSFLTGEEAAQAYRDFQAAKADEDFYNS